MAGVREDFLFCLHSNTSKSSKPNAPIIFSRKGSLAILFYIRYQLSDTWTFPLHRVNKFRYNFITPSRLRKAEHVAIWCNIVTWIQIPFHKIGGCLYRLSNSRLCKKELTPCRSLERPCSHLGCSSQYSSASSCRLPEMQNIQMELFLDFQISIRIIIKRRKGREFEMEQTMYFYIFFNIS